MSDLYLVSKDDVGSSLVHYRTKGSKNGVRRWQNEDGSLTPEGYRHYADMYGWGSKKMRKLELNTNIRLQESRAKKFAVPVTAGMITGAAGGHILDNGIKNRDRYEAALGTWLTGVGIGATAIFGLRSTAAADRVTPLGHSNAAQKYEETYDKMLNDLAGTEFEKPFRDQFERDWSKDEFVRSQFDKLNSNMKYKVGNKALSEIDKLPSDAELEDSVELRKWVSNRLSEKVFDPETGIPVRGSNFAKSLGPAIDDFQKLMIHKRVISQQVDSVPYIEGEPSYKRYKRIDNSLRQYDKLLNDDKLYKALSNVSGSGRNLNRALGAALKDLGFPDTPENRSFLYKYIWMA